MKKAKKRAKGLEERIAREEFLQELKNPTPKQDQDETAQDILKKIRERAGIKPYSPKKNISAYDAGPDGAMGSILKKIRKVSGIR